MKLADCRKGERGAVPFQVDSADNLNQTITLIMAPTWTLRKVNILPWWEKEQRDKGDFIGRTTEARHSQSVGKRIGSSETR